MLKRSNILKNNFSHIEKAIMIVELGIGERLTPVQISKRLQANIRLNYKYFNTVFRLATGQKLGQYIRRRKLAVNFETWKREKPKLSKTAKYKGEPRFLQRFYKEFGMTAKEAEANECTESQLQAKLDISNHIPAFQVLERLMCMNIVIDYDFCDNQKILLEINTTELLLLYLRQDIFLLPDVLAEEFQGMSKENQAAYVIMHKRGRDKRRKDLVAVSSEECMYMEKLLLGYEYFSVGDVLVVKPEAEESLKPVFNILCDALLPYIYSVMHNQKIPQTLETELNTIDKSKDILALSQSLKLNLTETRELIWKYLIQGCLRISRVEEGVKQVAYQRAIIETEQLAQMYWKIY